MQEIPAGGLKPDQIHLTYAQPFFDSPENMQMGWPVRNLTDLQMLDFLDNEQLRPLEREFTDFRASLYLDGSDANWMRFPSGS